uniref:AI812156 n=1 Tax=Arundo donax TaxID=35708 RepID=A0A0A9D633_ARUDO
MRTKTWPNSSQDIKIWLVFCTSTRWHRLIARSL